MDKKEYFYKVIKNYILRLKDKSKINAFIQEKYNKHGYGYDDVDDALLLIELQNYNMSQEVPYLATGQSGYFHEQIMKNGLGNFRLDPQDREDAKYISRCFGKNTAYSENNIPITYTTLLGSTEFNYATQLFPAGIIEDVFQCNTNHTFPIEPLVGEKEEDFYLRLLEFQIGSCDTFDHNNKSEALNRGKRLIHNFCSYKNKVYLIKLNDISEIKASFGDVFGLREGGISQEEAQQRITKLYSFSKLLESFYIDSDTIYTNPNMTSEFGIALYGIIPPDRIQYIEVERKYNLLQQRAIDSGISIGEPIPKNLDGEIQRKHI